MRRACLVLTIAVGAPLAFAAPAHLATNPPAGLTAFALDGKVSLAWQASGGATGYKVLRGTSPSAINTVVSPGSLTATSWVDTTTANGQAYYYAVKASDAGGDSAPSLPVAATPQAASCSTGNAVVRENCFPGSSGWKVPTSTDAAHGGIEGFTTKTSINRGDSVDLKISTAAGVPYHVEVYRTGWYGGSQGRLVETLSGRTGTAQPSCQAPNDGTGLIDCSNWSTSATLTTTQDWPTGAYLLRFVREDNSTANQGLLVVRNDGGQESTLYDVPVSAYQAYNNYGGRSLYDFNSFGSNTIAGTPRAVKVSYDRPFQEPVNLSRNWYALDDIRAVSWLERQGYDVAYDTSVDFASLGARRVFLSGIHDEYWSAGMRQAATSARDAGTSLFFLGGNAVYWRIRYEASPYTGQPSRLQVCYKTTQGAPVDPGGPTSTWRDPNGANQPENGLIGQMYIGDNDTTFFPMKVSAGESRNRVWRYSSIASAGPASLGQNLVGWEWDARVANGAEPPGVTTFTTSPVNGELLQDAGNVYANGSANVTGVSYRAASGALVVSTGTNFWSRGLALNNDGDGEPNADIQQATANALEDAGVRPATPDAVRLDSTTAPVVTSTSPASGATGVAVTSPVTATFNQSLDPSTVTNQSFTLTGPGGASIAASVTYNDATKTATLTPSQALTAGTVYTATLSNAIKNWNGNALTQVQWSFTTAGGTAPQVTSKSPAAGATNVATSTPVSATFDRALDPTSVNGQTFTLTDPGGATVAAQVTYNSANSTATLTPNASLAAGTQYTATLTTGIKASDATPMRAAVTWSFTTQAPLTITSRTPAPFASGVSPQAVVRAVFSRAVDPTTVTASNFTLQDPSGASVPGSVSYDPTTRAAMLTPSQTLALSATYTATVTNGIRATDGGTLGAPVSWTFTTASTPPPAPQTTGFSPAAGATGVALNSPVQATFDRALDAATVTGQSAYLTDPSGAVVSATVGVDGSATTVTITPTASLAVSTTYTAHLTTTIRSSDGTPMASTVTWSFTTAGCPCSLFSSSTTPALTGLSTQDGRSGSGPWSYEMGVKFTVSQSTPLTAFRFYKDASETGTHVGTLWTASGTTIASATFTNETAPGWQQQALNSPVTLQPGQTYVASVGINAFFVDTYQGLLNQITVGPLSSVADGQNGVYGSAAGVFPTGSYNSSNYFVDVVVGTAGPPPPPQPPQVTSKSPVDGATGVATNATVSATFNRALDPATVNGQSVTLTSAGGSAVAANVSYNSTSQTATLTPSSPLANSTSYTAQLTTAIHASDGTPLASPVSWSFSTAAPAPPTVTSKSPAGGASNVSTTAMVRATFSQDLDPTTVNTNTFKLADPNGAAVPASVTYNSAARTATLTPTSALAAGTSYTATLTTGIKSSAGVAMTSAYSWSFTTAACPCALMTGLTPKATRLPVQDGRGGSGPWSYEMGTKIQVTSAASLTAIRFYKDSAETGSHVGSVWNSSGTKLAQTTFSNETSSGWQQQALSSPVPLTPGQVYIVSVGINAYFVMTKQGLQTQLTNGPLQSVADGKNGVFGSAAGVFPTQTYKTSNYFADAVVS